MSVKPIAGAAVPLSEAERARFAAQGAYRPDFEHDACGVGFVADVAGRRTHGLVEKALSVLANLEHRGAAASDPLTGDGAGLLTQIPHRLLAEECARLGISLGQEGHYGLGMVFMPRDPEIAARARDVIRRVVEEEGQALLGIREVPVDPSVLGPAALASVPRIEQVLVGPGTLEVDDNALERRLYVIRKRIESEVARQGATEGELPYFPSFSTRTVVYKGLLTPEQLPRFYRDLGDERAESALAILHQRFSTNTFPSWSRAHPYRRVAHNGEINTLRGNVSWMRAREAVLRSPSFGEDIGKLTPIVDTRGSDSAQFDDVLELLVHTGRSLPHAVMMMIPEAWRGHADMNDELRAFYEYHACAMEPWDGPACIVFSDGVRVGAVLDRNGLRPARYVVTNDGFVVMASEVGVLDLPDESIAERNRLRPGRMFLVDTSLGRILPDAEIKQAIARRRPYRRWIDENLVRLDALPEASEPPALPSSEHALAVFGYTREEVRDVVRVMAETGEEPFGSMGNDTPLAALSEKPQLVFSYFRQLFAQVTNPPIDPIREALVMSLVEAIGPESNLFEESPAHVRKLELRSPILTCEELERIRSLDQPMLHAATVSCVARLDGEKKLDLAAALDRIGQEARAAVLGGASILVLSDREALTDASRVPIPSLLAIGAVHFGLHEAGLRQRCGLVVESGEPREVMHFALLIGYGAGAVCPYVALDAIASLARDGELSVALELAQKQYVKAIEKGLLKILSKMGISTLQSYRGAQIFECLGLDEALVERFFAGTPVHLPGLGLPDLERELLARRAWSAPKHVALARVPDAGIATELPHGGQYRYRRDGEHHAWGPASLALLQHAVRSADREKFRAFARRADEEARSGGFVRGLFDFVPGAPVPLDEVEDASVIVKRFKTGAMSFGSISKEAHETLALAMNSIGARSNTGEGGEDPARYVKDADGRSRRSAIKQVASGRFGVTTQYVVEADELQIKIAQGAKPGEGGQLPGHKVDAEIARVRHATVGVGLVSPPPHHDIYSIEDLAELVFDLKNANPRAEISVKLVAESGVGTVAAGVAKSKADVIVIAGDSGGTGASPLSSVRHAGIPWEIGLAETQQTLVLNGLRSRVRLETDGQLKTARDVVIAAMLGAEEMAFGTAALVSMGCVMMRACHLNTCPVGVATQDPVLRARFAGEPEHVITFFTFLAEEVRALMASLGFRTFDEMVGAVERLRARTDVPSEKAAKLRVDRLLLAPPAGVARRRLDRHDHELELAMDTVLIEQARAAFDHAEPVEIEMPIRNVHRAATTMLSAELVRRRGGEGLPDGTIRIRFVGSAGQSFGAFLASGIDVTLVGDANDGFGKSLSGGRVVVHPSPEARFAAEDNVIVGNVALYGATSGEAFIRGQAGERFAVRNSGAIAVVEGVGDHGCEYMTGGRVARELRDGRARRARTRGSRSGALARASPLPADDVARRVAHPLRLEDVEPPLRARDARRVQARAHAQELARRRHFFGGAHGSRAMTKPSGFLELARRDPDEREVAERVHDFRAIERRLPVLTVREQARRCMGCGVPFCHAGCPLGNPIPDFQDAVERGRWAEAFALLDQTNNFPEVTGRVCPAPCEAACVLGIDPAATTGAVTIESIEREIATRAFDEGWVRPRPPERETGRRVTVVGSGPAGLAAAQQLRRAGHRVTVIERSEKPGGLLRFGIPDFKLDKGWLDRRLAQIEEEGVVLRCGVTLGEDVTLEALRATEDAVVIATGATVPRDLPVAGRGLAGVHFAMDFLAPQNRVVSGALTESPHHAKGKRVLVLGGGDTGSDCVGTALRQGAASVTSIELLPRPPEQRASSTPWPLWPVMFRVSSSHEEGGAREFALRTTHFVDDGRGRVAGIACIGVERRGGELVDLAGTERVLEADLVLLALGFVGPERAPIASVVGERGLVAAGGESFETAIPGVFACGDARRGQSLVVWAIWEGRRAAASVDAWLHARPVERAMLAPEIPF